MAKASIWAQPAQTDAQPVMDPGVFASIGGNANLPEMPDSPAPAIVKIPTPLESLVARDSGRLQQLEKPPTPWAQLSMGHKIGRVFADIGNAAGDVFAPSRMALIPGTQLHKESEEAALAKRLPEEEKEAAAEHEAEPREELERAQAGEANARTNALENPAPADTRPYTLNTSEGILERTPQGWQPVTVNGKAAMPYERPAAGAHDAFSEWGSDPANFEKFTKTMAEIKAQVAAEHPQQAKNSSFMNIYAAQRFLHDAYQLNPRLLTVAGPMISKLLGLSPEEEKTIEAVPTGQPQNAEGQPIGLSQPESPTGATRSRGQFAQSVLPSVGDAKQEISELGAELGPMQGRWLDFYDGKIGNDNPRYTALRTTLHNIGTAWMRLHANSETARQDFQNILATAQSPGNLIASLDALEKQAGDYVKEGKGRPDELNQGASNAPKVGDVVDGYRFKGGDPGQQSNWEAVKK